MEILNHFNSAPKRTTLKEVYETIKTNVDLKNQTALLRKVTKESGKDAAKSIKRNLPAFIVGGHFEDGRKSTDFVHANGLIVIDIDNCGTENPDINTVDTFALTLEPVFKYISASGNGLKIVFRYNIPSEDRTSFKACKSHHLNAFNNFKLLFEKEGIEIDKACKDINRLSFLCHDPNVYLNENGKTHFFEKISIEKQTKKVKRGDNLKKLPNAEFSIDPFLPLIERKFKEYEMESGSKFGPGNRHAILIKCTGLSIALGFSLKETIETIQKVFGESQISYENIQEVRNAYQTYEDSGDFGKFSTHHKSPEHTIKVERYIGEKSKQVSAILDVEDKIILRCLTGGGKTTFIYDYAKEVSSLHKKTIAILAPTRALGRQISESTGLPYFDGSSPFEQVQAAIQSPVYVTNYKQVAKKFVDPDIFIMDEIHDLVYNFKSLHKSQFLAAWYKLEKKKIIGLTATPEDIPFLSDFKLLNVETSLPAKTVQIRRHTSRNNNIQKVVDIIENANKKDFILIENNNIKENEMVRDIVINRNIFKEDEIITLSSKTKDSDFLKNLESNPVIPDNIKVIVTTSMVEMGINMVTDRKASVHHIWNYRTSNITSPFQLFGRIRESRGLELIIHTNNSKIKNILYPIESERISFEEWISSFINGAGMDGKKKEREGMIDPIKNYIYRDGDEYKIHPLALAAKIIKEHSRKTHVMDQLRRFAARHPEYEFVYQDVTAKDFKLSEESREAIKRAKAKQKGVKKVVTENIIENFTNDMDLSIACAWKLAGEDNSMVEWAADKVQNPETYKKAIDKVAKMDDDSKAEHMILARRIKRMNSIGISLETALKYNVEEKDGELKMLSSSKYMVMQKKINTFVNFITYKKLGKDIFKVPDRLHIEKQMKALSYLSKKGFFTLKWAKDKFNKIMGAEVVSSSIEMKSILEGVFKLEQKKMQSKSIRTFHYNVIGNNSEFLDIKREVLDFIEKEKNIEEISDIISLEINKL